MATYYRAITQDDELIIVEALQTRSGFARPGSGFTLTLADFKWIDSLPYDIGVPRYRDGVQVTAGDKCCAGGEEFRVEAFRPATTGYPYGQLRGGSIWYSCEHVTRMN